MPDCSSDWLSRKYGFQRVKAYVATDSTAIQAREKAAKKEPKAKPMAKKRGRPKKGEERPVSMARIERQAAGMSLAAMLEELPKPCDVGSKRNSKGYKTSWVGYKLHIDAADAGIPISCLLSSASIHDSQAAIPLAEITNYSTPISQTVF